MTHNSRCANSKSPISKCRCSCGGLLHGSGFATKHPFPPNRKTRFISGIYGGQLKIVVDLMNKRKVKCPECGNKYENTNGLWGYPDENGYRDKHGIGWELITTCPKCLEKINVNKLIGEKELLEAEMEAAIIEGEDQPAEKEETPVKPEPEQKMIEESA